MGWCLREVDQNQYHREVDQNKYHGTLSLKYHPQAASPLGGTLVRGRGQTSRRPLTNTRYLLGGTQSSTTRFPICIVLPRAPKASAALAQFTRSPPTGSRSGVRGAWQGCLMEGMLLKQGGKRSHAFKKRWITLSGVTVTYASSKTATALGEVPMAEVLGLGVSDEGADDAGKGIRLLWRKSCAGLDADYRRAQGYSVGQVPAFPLASSSMFSTSFDRWLVLWRNRKN